jgi:hypothetical protein
LSDEKAEQAVKKALNEDISTTERYPPDEIRPVLKKWLTKEDFKKREQTRKIGNNEMKERKPDVDRKEDAKGVPRKEQVAISRLRTGYTRATLGPKMERVVQSTMNLLQHRSIYRPHTVGMQRNWGPESKHGHKKETMDQREKIIDYAKEIRLYNGI